MKSAQVRHHQAGFTLIELVVVIVILGILAATALPRFLDLSADARIAKMNAALGSLRSASGMAHASWLAGGGVYGCAACGPAAAGSTAGTAVVATPVTMEGQNIPMQFGYPDVGGDGFTDTAVPSGPTDTTTTTNSGIVRAAGGLTDYVVRQTGTGTIEVTPDAGHPNCRITYQEATGVTPTGIATPTLTNPPVFTSTDLIAANC